MRGPVFIHLRPEDCGGAGPEVAQGEVPAGVLGSRRVLRAYDAGGSIPRGVYLQAEEARIVEDGLAELYQDSAVAAVHLRAVEFGCFLMETRRRQRSRFDDREL